MKEKKQQVAVPLTGSLNDLLENYGSSLKALNRSPKTIDWYLDILDMFFGFLSLNNLLKPSSELGRQELKSYLLYLQERNRWPGSQHINDKSHLSPHSIQGHVRAIKAFWSWLLGEGLIPQNPLAKFPLPKVPQNIIKTMTAEDMKKLLSAVDRSTPVGDRLYCVLMVLMDTGVRISELVNIKIPNINMSRSIMTVTGKGQKQRDVPFSNIIRKDLIRFINKSRPLISIVESDYLFPAKYGDHLSITSVQQALKRLSRKAGITKCNPHIFRHTFATMFIASNGSAPILKEIMGHQSFQTTEKYIHLKADDLKRQHQIHSPMTEIFTKK
ncbi:Tyrosine recombinase XerC [subsurface metagenome]